MNRNPTWNALELDQLRSGYGHMPIAELAAALGRTKQAIRTKARDLCLQRDKAEPKPIDHATYLPRHSHHDERLSDDWKQTTDARIGSLRLLQRLNRAGIAHGPLRV